MHRHDDDAAASGRSNIVARVWGARHWILLGLISVCAALGLGVGRFYRSNQNTYLLHTVGPSLPRLRDDWLLGSTDPFPVFTDLATAVYSVGGNLGLGVLTVLNAVIAFSSLAVIAYVFASRSHSMSVMCPALAVLTLPVWFHVRDWWAIPGFDFIEPLSGFGGQYVLNYPGTLQPSDSGVLLFGAIALVVLATRYQEHRRWLHVGAAVLTAVTPALHPSYLAPVMVALGSMLMADLLLGHRFVRLSMYTTTGMAAVALLLLSNPIARSVGVGPSDAQEFLSFERVPHHTLMSQWSFANTVAATVIIIVGALFVKRYVRSWWLTGAILSALTVSLVAATVVEVTRSVTLASVFPWRITVILVPLCTVIIALVILEFAARRAPQLALAGATVVVAFALATLGVRATIEAAGADQSAVVEWIRGAEPSGTGLIPLGYQDVRLNGRVAIYVDFKSHPYDRNELAEWVRRVENVRRVNADVQRLCEFVDAESIDWVLLARAGIPECLSEWTNVDGDEMVILMRPR